VKKDYYILTEYNNLFLLYEVVLNLKRRNKIEKFILILAPIKRVIISEVEQHFLFFTGYKPLACLAQAVLAGTGERWPRRLQKLTNI
jgi:hypothetical protein